MKGLLMKDLLTLKGQYIFYIALIVLFALVPSTGAMMALVLAAVVPKAALAYGRNSASGICWLARCRILCRNWC